MNAKRIVLLLVLVFLISGCDRGQRDSGSRDSVETEGKSNGNNASPTPESTQPSRTGTIVLADGQLVAVRPALPLSFIVNGRLLETHVQEGDVVEEGDILATLDETNLSDALTNAQLQVAQTEITLAQTQLSLEELINWEPDDYAVAVCPSANLDNAIDAPKTPASNRMSSVQMPICVCLYDCFM